MDIATVGGLVIGILMLILALTAGGAGGLGGFIDPTSVFVTLGGGTAASLMSMPLKDMLGIMKVTQKAIFTKAQAADELIRDMVSYAETARRDGILSLESRIDEIKDPFVVSGIQMAVDGTDPEMIEAMMNTELEQLEERHKSGVNIFSQLGKYLPAFGMIGTLIGLVKMLQGLDDPSTIGAGMAVALLTTLYGAIASNLFALPIADKLKKRSEEEVLLKNIVIQGVMAIQSGDNPRIVEQKLLTYLPPSLRDGAAAER